MLNHKKVREWNTHSVIRSDEFLWFRMWFVSTTTFYSSIIFQFLKPRSKLCSFIVNWLVIWSKNWEKRPSHVSSEVFKCLLLSDQQFKTRKYSVYNHIKQRNIYIGEAGTREWLALLLENDWKWWIDYQKINFLSINQSISWLFAILCHFVYQTQEQISRDLSALSVQT